MEQLYIYLQTKDQTFLYQTVIVNDKLYQDVIDYINQFNQLSERYKGLYSSRPGFQQLLFSVSRQDLGHPVIKDEIGDYFHKFVTRIPHFDKFVLGWNKYLVDDVFRMYEVRPFIPYDNWRLVKLYFNNGNTLATVGEFGLQASDADTVNVFLTNVDVILNWHGGNFDLISDNGEEDTYGFDQVFVNEENIYDYYKPKTILKTSFWRFLLTMATDDELDDLYRLPDDKMRQLIELEQRFRKEAFIEEDEQPIGKREKGGI